MKPSIRLYAKALLEIADDLPKQELRLAINRWLTELKNKNLLGYIKEIIREIEKLDETAEGIIRARLISTYKLSTDVLNQFTELVIKRTKAKKIIWEEIIDKKVIGGVIISYQDTIIDMSLANRINELALEIKK